MCLGKVVADGTDPKGDADVPAPELLLLLLLLRLTFHYAPPLFATRGGNVPDAVLFY